MCLENHNKVEIALKFRFFAHLTPRPLSQQERQKKNSQGHCAVPSSSFNVVIEWPLVADRQSHAIHGEKAIQFKVPGEPGSSGAVERSRECRPNYNKFMVVEFQDNFFLKLKFRYYEKAKKFEKISTYFFCQNSCFYSLSSKHVGDFLKFLWSFH